MRRGIFRELHGLLGKAIDSKEVIAFLAKYPHHKVGKLSDAHQAVLAYPHGFEMTFSPPDGSFPGGRTVHLRVLTTLFLNSNAVRKFETFTRLPLRLSFADRFDQMNAKLGKPLRVKKRDTGELAWARWQIDDVIISASFPKGQLTTNTFALMTPAVAFRYDSKTK